MIKLSSLETAIWIQNNPGYIRNDDINNGMVGFLNLITKEYVGLLKTDWEKDNLLQRLEIERKADERLRSIERRLSNLEISNV